MCQTSIFKILLFASSLSALLVRASPTQLARLTPRQDTPAEDPWMETMEKIHFPTDEEMCKMDMSPGPDTWVDAKTSVYFSFFMQDNDKKLDKWPQRMLENATGYADLDAIPELDCSTLGSRACTGPSLGYCENYYTPASFYLIHTQLFNFVSILSEMDINTLKDTFTNSLGIEDMIGDLLPQEDKEKVQKGFRIAATIFYYMAGVITSVSTFGAGSIGASTAFGTVTTLGSVAGAGSFAAGMTAISLNLFATIYEPDGSIDLEKLDDKVKATLSTFYESFTDYLSGLVAKVGGGETDMDINVMDVVAKIDPWYENHKDVEETTALLYLFQNGWFMNRDETKLAVGDAFKGGLQIMKLSMIGTVMQAMKGVVIRETIKGEEICKENADGWRGVRYWVDDSCYTFWRMGDKKFDMVPLGFLEKTETYGLNTEGFIKNVRACNNNEDLMFRQNFTSIDMDTAADCMFGVYYLEAPFIGAMDCMEDPDKAVLHDRLKMDLGDGYYYTGWTDMTCEEVKAMEL